MENAKGKNDLIRCTYVVQSAIGVNVLVEK